MTLEAYMDALQRKTERWRELSLSPLLRLLVKSGISAHALSTLRIMLALAFPFLMPAHAPAAWSCIALSILLDAVDGTLARFAKAASDRGKFIDVLADQATFALLAAGLIRAFPEYSLALAVSAFAIPLLYIMVSVAANEKKPSDWLIRPQARLTGYKIIFLLMIAAAWFGYFSPRTIRSLLWLEIAACSLHFFITYFSFITRPAPKF